MRVISRFAIAAIVAGSSLLPAHAEESRNGLIVTAPNGYANLGAGDLQLKSTAGSVRWVRAWNGEEWKFNPQWESLSQSWKNLTGSQTQDSSSLSNGDSTSSGVVLDTPVIQQGTISSGGGGGGGGCWVWVDEDWQPTYGAVLVQGLRDAGPMVPLRSTPFNRVMDESGTDYAAASRVSVDFASLCAGSSSASGAVSMEGIRRINELHLGENGRYSFNNRTVLEKRVVQQLAAASTASLGTGQIALTLVSNDKGFRWIDRAGAWIDYNTQGQVVAYGDRNDNTVWLARDASGILRGVVDATGRVLFTLHYTGQLVTEVKDYPVPGLAVDLPARSVKYTYDERNRLTQVTDVRGNVTQFDYDIANHIVKITDQEGHVEQLAYNGEEVRQRIAADGGVTDYAFDYDDTNKQFISKITGPETAAGRRVEDLTQNRVGKLVRRIFNGQTDAEVRYDTGARSETVTNARGFSTRTTRNEFNQPVEVGNPDGTTVKYTYSALNLTRTERVDEAGVRTVYLRDARGNLLKTTRAVGTPDETVTEYERNVLGQTTQATLKGRTELNGTVTPDAVWLAEYDARGKIQKITDPEGNATQYGFDRAGNLALVTDAIGRNTRYESDADGNLVKVTDALGQEYVYTYNKVGNLTQQTDARGRALQIAYDAMNRVQQVVTPVGGAATVQYDRQGRPTQFTDEDGQTIRFEFDAFQRLTQVMDGRSNTAQLSYQIADGSQAGALGSLGAPTQVRYPTFTSDTRFDPHGRPTSLVVNHTNTAGAERLTWARSYDARGRVVSETDAYGRVRHYSYNTFGQLLLARDALGGEISARYDGHGNLRQLTDQNGNTTRFEYDRNGRLTQETLPLGQRTRYAYNTVDRLRLRTDALGNTREYTYDALDRLTQTVDRSSTNQVLRTATYTWDANSNLTAWSETDATRPAGQQSIRSSLTYDDANRKTAETISYPIASGVGYSLTYRYAYSPAGRKTQLVWADGTTIDYGYAEHGQLQSVAIPGEGNISVNQFRWDAPSQITLPGGSTQNKAYDGLLNLQSLSVRSPSQQTSLSLQNSYGRELELKQSTRTDAAGNGTSTISHAYSYDNEIRLTEAVKDVGGVFGRSTETFGLDSVANRVAHSAVSGAWVYDANNRLLQRGVGATYSYDDAGNQTQRQQGALITRYRHDSANRLTEVRDISNRLVARYGYDPMHRRAWKEQYRDAAGNALSPAKRTYYLYSDEGLIAEAEQTIGLNVDESVSATGEPQIRVQYAPRPDALFSTAPLLIKTKDSNGNDMVAYYHHDHQGTPIQATDRAGRVVWSASYDAFGRASITTPSATSELPTIESNLRLAGQYFDAETGLHYNWHRYYEPESGRYIEKDPIGFSGGMNLYAYVSGRPLQYVDPYGLGAIATGMGVLGGRLGGIGGAAAGTAVAPGPGTAVGAIAGSLAGRWAGRALGTWIEGLIFNEPVPVPNEDAGESEEAGVADGASCPIPGAANPDITADDLRDKTRDEVRQLAQDKGLVPDPKKKDKWRDPDTGKERLRIDEGHVDKNTGQPYDDPRARGPHTHGYDKAGNPISDPHTVNDPHFPNNKHFPNKP